MNRQIFQLLKLTRRCVLQPRFLSYGMPQEPKQEGTVHKGYAKLKKIQAQYQKDDKLPVFLKGGKTDETLFQVTLGLTVIGLLYMLAFLVGYILSGLPGDDEDCSPRCNCSIATCACSG